jgi:putative transposase
MPSRNSIKQYAPNSYYHVYNRGVAKLPIFLDDHDKEYFLHLLKRHLDPTDTSTDRFQTPYKKFDDVKLLSYCLMHNHFHLLIYQIEPMALADFMKSILTAYTMYFNKKYKRVGHLFQGRFKASLILDDAYLLHITRYIHLNPYKYRTYTWSSYGYYIGQKKSHWMHPELILSLFRDVKDYSAFVHDYEDYHQSRDTVLSNLAIR